MRDHKKKESELIESYFILRQLDALELIFFSIPLKIGEQIKETVLAKIGKYN